VSGLAVARGRWPLVLLATTAARVVLDPGTNRYYAAGIVVDATVWDLLGPRRSFPWWTALSCLLLFAARNLPLPPATNGIALIAVCGRAAPPARTDRPPPVIRAPLRGGSRGRAGW
jgi:hypothetical protein